MFIRIMLAIARLSGGMLSAQRSNFMHWISRHRRSLRFSRLKTLVILFALAVNVKSQPVSNPVVLYGWLDQHSLDTYNNFVGNEACVPSSTVNGLTYLQNINPSLYGTNLTGGTNISSTQGTTNSYQNWIRTDQTLINLFGTEPASQASSGGTSGTNNVNGTKVYLLRQGFYSDISVNQIPLNSYSNSVVTLSNAISNTNEAVLGIITYINGGGHCILLNGISWNSSSNNGTLYFIDPLNSSLNYSSQNNYSGTNVLGPVRQNYGSLSINSTNNYLLLNYQQSSNTVNPHIATADLTYVYTLSNSPSTNTNPAWINLVIGSNSTPVTYSITNVTYIYSNTTIGLETNSSNNQLIVANTNTLLSNSVDLYVGHYGASNSMTITNGGVVVGEYGILGNYSTSSNNSVQVTGTNSVWTNAGDIAVGFDGSGNRMVISNGAKVSGGSDGAGGIIGADQPSSNNSVLVTGSNSSWINSLDLYVGFAGGGNSLMISNGAVVINQDGYIGTYYQSSNNSVVVSGANSLWSNSGEVMIGNFGSGNSLTISNGGRVVLSGSTNWLAIGENHGANSNTVTVTGSNSQLNVTGWLEVGWGSNTGNQMLISDGGLVSDSNGYIGYTNGSSSNSVAVSTSGTWSNSSSFYVGYSGSSNNLVISGAGTVTDLAGTIGYHGDGNGATVTGSNSLWSNASSLTVGNCGNAAQLTISNGGGVISSSGLISAISGWSNCSVTVTGAGSYWSNSGNLTIGSQANGLNAPSSGNSLTISSGGEVSDSNAVIANATSFFNNTVTVTGFNSLWSNSGSIDLGVLGSQNSLVISNGGSVLAAGIIETNGTTDGPLAVATTLGDSNASSNNSVLITGSGSSMTNAGRLRIGYYGSGNSLTVTNGGQLIGTRNANITLGYDTNSSNNSLLISGLGSLSSNNGGIYVGYCGSSNTLTLTDGAVMRSGSTNSAFYGSSTNYNDAYVGFGSSSSNNAVLIDSNAQWIHAGTNYIGYGGSGTVTVANGGVLAASKILIGHYGALDFGRYQQSDSAGLVVGDIVFTANNDENFGINFNQTNTFTFSNNVSGPGWICALATGTTIISGSNSFSQYTKIDAGTIIAESANALGTGYLQIGGTTNRATIMMATNLSVGDFIWQSNGVVAVTVGSQTLTVVNMTNLVNSNGGSVFNLQGTAQSMYLNNTTNTLINFTSQTGFTTNSYGVQGMSGYEFFTNANKIQVAMATNATAVVSMPVIVTNTFTARSLSIGGNGSVSGVGTIISPVTNGGLVIPGNSNSTTGILNIVGNYTQTPTGTLQIKVFSPGNFGIVNVTGSVFLGGTLVITPVLGSQLQFGEKLQFLTSTGAITGSFNYSKVPAGERARLVIEGDPTASILIAPQSYVQMARTANQTNVATALNSFIPASSGDRQVVATSLDSLSASEYNQAFNAIMPTYYQQFATIAFNEANALNMELNQRLWGLRVAEDGGFSMSGLADNYPMMQEGPVEGQGDASDSGGKRVLDAKKDILRPGLDNHWGMFVDGNGIFAQANSGNMLPGYNSESGGVTAGLTYKWNEHVSSGIYTGYQGTYTKSGSNVSGLGNGSSLYDNAVRFGVFGTYGQQNGKGFYANALAGGAYHNYQATRVIQYTGMNRTANSATGAGELDTMLATGYDIQKGKFTFGPTASLQYTYLGVNGVNETGAQSLNFNSGGWNSSSLLSSVGAHAAYNWVAHHGSGGDVVVVPQINLSWQHEFLQDPYDISGNLGGSSLSFNNTSSTGIRDYLYTGVGFTVEFVKKWNTGFFYNASAGNANLTSQNIFWSVGLKF